MAFSPTTRRFTVKDYHRMVEADILKPKDRVELVDGEVVDMSPIGTRHASCVDRMARFLILGTGDRAIVRVQGPIQLGELSEPQPDLVVLGDRSDFYANHHPTPVDVLLAVEVSDSSLQYDLLRKAPLYIAGGVPEVWVIDLVGNLIHVVRGDTAATLSAGDSLSPLAFPDIVLDVASLVG